MTPHLKRGLKNYCPDPDVQKIVVVGCGKSGTNYMAHYFGHMRFALGHEVMGRNGISSWYEVSDQRSKDIQQYYEGHQCLYIHLVRHPLDVIASLWRPEVIRGRRGLQFFHINCPEYDCLTGYDYVAKHWVVWNKKVEENFSEVNPVLLQVEIANRPAAIAYFCDQLGVEYTQDLVDKIRKMSTNTHSKAKKEIPLVKAQGHEIIPTDDLVNHIDPTILAEVRDLANKYHYFDRLISHG